MKFWLHSSQVREKMIRDPSSNTTDKLEKVYIEPTNACNLDCRTCMRNVWDENPGYMDLGVFSKIILDLNRFDPKPMIFFGGYGEPLSHPNILDMIGMAKYQGFTVELITNGTLLIPAVAAKLVSLCIDRIWVSLDGSTRERYADVRLGDELPQVIANLEELLRLRTISIPELPKLGIAFVAMKRNISDLPPVIQLGKRLGADMFYISNVLAHTKELQQEVLYQKSLYFMDDSPSHWMPKIQLPRMDLNESTQLPLIKIMKSRNNFGLARKDISTGSNSCPFIESNSTSIRWDGSVSPCLPLLHSHESYLDDSLRKSYSFSVGNVKDKSLNEIWNDQPYQQLRDRLKIFDFSPCTYCNSCELAEANLEDCFGNAQPACGGCLWAQGFIQCP
jgi:MoaA/NifB/PqqE/SkfB family radical SAM enzyme